MKSELFHIQKPDPFKRPTAAAACWHTAVFLLFNVRDADLRLEKCVLIPEKKDFVEDSPSVFFFFLLVSLRSNIGLTTRESGRGQSRSDKWRRRHLRIPNVSTG